MPETPIPGSDAAVRAQTPVATSLTVPAQTSTGREILRVGLWNYASQRWGPKNPVARFAVEIGILVVFLLIVAIVLKLSQG